MKHDDGATAQIVEQLEQSGLETVMLDGVRPVEAAIRYFRARLARMACAGARREGLRGNTWIHKPKARVRAVKTVFRRGVGVGTGWGVAKIVLPEGRAGVAEPLRALMAEVDREGHVDRPTPPDLAAVSAQWARVSDAIRVTVRARIAHAQAAQR